MICGELIRSAPLSLADSFSVARIVLLVPIAVVALAGFRSAFVWLVCVAMATDAIDGHLARRSGTASARGARLDSLADAMLHVVVGICSVFVFPEVWRELPRLVMVTLACLLMPPLIGYARYGQLPAFHTRLARVASVAMAVGFFSFAFLDRHLPLQVAVVVLVLSVLEEMAIMWVLPQWTPQVSSVRHAVELARCAPLRRSLPLTRRSS